MKTVRREGRGVKTIRRHYFATVKVRRESSLARAGWRFEPCTRQRWVARWGTRLVKCVFALKGRFVFEEYKLQIPKYALDILVCPVCKARVELLADESGLKCVSCRRVYPIRDEIPVMLPEEATIAEEPRDH